MLQRVSEAQYIEALHKGLTDVLRARRTSQPVSLMSPLLQQHDGTWYLRSEILFVPICLTSYVAHHGRKPHDHG